MLGQNSKQMTEPHYSMTSLYPLSTVLPVYLWKGHGLFLPRILIRYTAQPSKVF